MVILDDTKDIRFGGIDVPALFVEVKSIGLLRSLILSMSDFYV